MKTLYEIYTKHNRRSDAAVKQAIERSMKLIAKCDRVLRESQAARASSVASKEEQTS
ncbi:hypothetical protein [Caballeronia zhejiangensis]|uniref:hypothetical protein n=1 Tax=Caballeronia zhejiangensis TaxID=871203 RepID=UPI000A60814E|nr:hypothetical protein [Caballeronia zhejiangensis]